MSPDAAALDREDALAPRRERFLLPPETIYLNGNSLGPLGKAAQARVQETLNEQWGRDLISSWNRHGWIDLPQSCGARIAPLLGAAPEQVICCDSISINLFKLLSAALHLQPGRSVMLSTGDNFPTDLYAAQGLSRLLEERRCRMQTVQPRELESALDEDVAVLLLSHVNFRSAACFDIETLTRRAHAQGVLVIWDLAHSAGVMPLELDAWDVDFAVGCGYKYLNGGPGAPAFVYVNRRLQDSLWQPLQGWMGHRSPFDFSPEFEAAEGSVNLLSGTPPILAMAALDGALEDFSGLTSRQLRDKSRRLGALFQEGVGQSGVLAGLRLRSPDAPEARGGHIAYAHEQAWGISQALIERGIIVDFRSPDLIRFGFSPLYLSFADVARAVETLEEIIESGEQIDGADRARNKVT